MRQRLILPVLVLALIPGVGRAAFADGLQLNYKVTRAATGRDGAQTTKESHHVIKLYPHSVSERDGAVEKVFDYAASKEYLIDHDHKTIVTLPLSVLPLDRESQKRKMVAAYRQAREDAANGKDKTKLPDLRDVDFDMLYGSMGIGASYPPIDHAAQADGSVLFTAEHRALATYALSGTSIPDDLKDSYNKFLLTEVPVQRDIRMALVDTGKAAQALTIRNRTLDNPVIDTTMELTGTERLSGDTVKMPDGFSQAASDDSRLAGLIERTHTDKPATLAAMESRAQGFAAQHRFLEALLVTYEYSLMYGPEELDKSAVFARVVASAGAGLPSDTMQIFSWVDSQPSTKDELKRRLDLLDSLKASAGKRDYVLDAMKTNQLALYLAGKDGQDDSDAHHIKQVINDAMADLDHNPFMMQSWLTLATLYNLSGEPNRAAECSDAAIQLSPHADESERAQSLRTEADRMRSDYPDYF